MALLEEEKLIARHGGRDRRGGRDFWLLLETGAAKDGSPLRGLERDRGFSAAGRASGAGFRTHPAAAGALGLALLAMLGIVLELFVVKKQLFTGGEHELRSAVVTLQNSIDKFHGRFPKAGRQSKSAMNVGACRSRFPVLNVLEQQGPGPQQTERRCCSAAPSLQQERRNISRLFKLQRNLKITVAMCRPLVLLYGFYRRGTASIAQAALVAVCCN